MRTRLALFIVIGICGYASSGAARSAALQSMIDAYIAQVGEMAGNALMPELAKHRELVKGTTKFSFRLDPAGHPSHIEAISAPRNKFVEQTTLRVIRRMTFPAIPKKILQDGGFEYLEFRTEMRPLDQ
jgi:outer membrane biosynthesis protein TonB